MTTSLPLDSIVIGERDRSEDMGDIAGLAASIKAVGLLHPVVVTAAGDLVAGGRRLAAVRALGWREVPVTVATIDTLAALLQAEADENTCRKGLTPYEASRARERRARLLAPKAAANKGGRPSETSPKLGEVSDRKEREVRKAAAVGTGYSATTIDKVDRIRDAAERGVIKRGKTEVPAPAPVVAVAREQLEHVKRTGAAIDRSAKALDAAVEAYVESDADVQRARFMRSFARSLEAYTAITAYDPEQVAAAITDPDEWEDFLRSHRTVNDWFTKVREARPARLRLIGGSQ